MKTIAWYCFDDLDNPYLAGGGARVCKEVVDRLSSIYGIEVLHGAYPGVARRRKWGATFRPLGLGWSPVVARITYTLAATWHSLTVRADVLLFSFSAYSPALGFVWRPMRSIVALYHLLDRAAWEKYGIAGCFPDWAERLALRYPFRYLVLSQAMAAHIDRLRTGARTRAAMRGEHGDGAQVMVAPPGIDEVDPSPWEHYEDYVVYWGRLDVHQKGLDILLDAWSLVETQKRLVIAGHGCDRDVDWLKNRLNRTWDLVELCRSDRVQFSTMPGMSQVDIRRYLFTHAAVAVYPSRYEGFCIAALEAQAYGIPVVAAAIPGLDEAVRDRVSGLLFRSEDSAHLASTLSGLLDNADLRCELGHGGRNHAARFTWDACAEAHRTMIDGVIAVC